MSFLKRLKYLFPSIREREQRDMDEELASLAAIAAGEGGRLGNLTRTKEDTRAVWGWNWIESLFADVRYAFRVLSKQRGFATVAILSLALGIGANSAIFSIIDRLLLQELPVAEPDRLVVLGNNSHSYFACTEFGNNSKQVLSDVLCTTDEPREVDTGGGPQRATVELVTGNYFNALGVQGRGRMIAPHDDQRAQPAQVAVISHSFWTRQFGADTGALGRTIRIQGAPFTVIGVAPAEFFGVVVGKPADVWIPITNFRAVFPGRNWLDRRTTNFLMVLGRLEPNVTVQQAAAVLSAVSVQINLDRFPNNSEALSQKLRSEKLQLVPAAKGISYLRARFSQPLRIIFAMVALALLLACVNLMNLQLAKASERRKELGVRLAIGASRARIIRQLLIESLLLALAGGAVGLLIAGPAARALTSLVHAGEASVSLGSGLPAKVLLFALAVSVLAALVFGLAPAWRATGVDFAGAVQQSSRTSTAAPRRRRLAQGLAAFQVALSVFLIAGACLFAASLYKLTHFHVGLERSRLIVLDVDSMEAGFKGPQMADLNRRLRDRFGELPGVEVVSFSENGFYAGRNSNRYVAADGFPPGNDNNHEAYYDQVGPAYFTTIGGTLIEGRDFTPRDDSSGPKVAIVNEEFARHFFPAKDPIGRNIYLQTPGAAEGSRQTTTMPLEVVGLVKDIRSENIRRPARRLFYVPQLQTRDELSSTRFIIRTKVDPKLLFPTLRNAVRAESPALPVLSIDTADDLLVRTLDRDRLIAALSIGFGILALVLAGVGTYGLLSYEVTRRTGEVGIRMALGAKRSDIVMLMLREVAAIAAAGVVVGIAGAMASGRIVTTLVFGLEPNDPRVLACAAVILLSVALCAGFLPARRAARMEPAAALRHE